MSALRYFHGISDYLPAGLACLDAGAYALWVLLSLTRSYATADQRTQGIIGLMLLNLFFVTYSPQYGIAGFFITGFSALISSIFSTGDAGAGATKKKD